MFAPYLPTESPQLMQGFFGFFFGWWFAMPMEIIFHKIHAFAGNSMSNNHGGLSGNSFGGFAGINNIREIMAVYFQHMPTKGFPFGP